MKNCNFRIVSHAGLLLEMRPISLLFDPWLSGSCYWRSWWNYPPVRDELVAGLRPDFIVLTHIHWDHFHGPSLRKMDRTTPILVPHDHYERITKDLRTLKFTDVRELKHGHRVRLADDLHITSFQFFPFTDSAVVLEAGDVTLLNANDSKFVGLPLSQILRRHPKIDFLFRSHSSANDRLCYEIIDGAPVAADDLGRYSEAFCRFVRKVNPRYAIPFASNHCHLHRDVIHFNESVQTPVKVAEHFAAFKATHAEVQTELQIMVSGDSWSAEQGFEIAQQDYFENREAHLARYAEEMAPKLEETYRKEASAVLNMTLVQNKLKLFSDALPWFVRRRFRSQPVALVLTAGDRREVLSFDVSNGTVKPLEHFDDVTHPLQFQTSLEIFQHALRMRLLSHLTISKRVRYRVTQKTAGLMSLLGYCFQFYEYELFPLRGLFRWRLVDSYLRRWREVVLYARLSFDLMRGYKPAELELRYLD